MASSEQRRNSTNSANDSKGHSLGLEGDQFMFVIAALVVGVVLMLACQKAGMSPGAALMVAVIPVPLVVIYLVVFKINKPPRYQGDLIQKWNGNTSIVKGKPKPNPYLEAKAGKKELKSKTYIFFNK